MLKKNRSTSGKAWKRQAFGSLAPQSQRGLVEITISWTVERSRYFRRDIPLPKTQGTRSRDP
ncbi:hypothetical protein N9L06_07320, partial [Mariniblastus sp.]|nr:hypothetical protein [Mariniblastus sp.]